MDRLNGLEEILSRIKFRAPAELLSRILTSIEKRRRRMAIFGTVAYFSLSILAVALFSSAGKMAGEALNQSGVSQLFSLIFSDFQSVLSNWSYFAMSLAESLPILPIVYFLLSALVLTGLISLLISNFKKVGQVKFHHFKNA